MSLELEIELKIPCADLAKVGERLLGMGAVPLGVQDQEDVYFTHPCRDFGESDEALRIRTAEGVRRLTYKGPKLDNETKTREELEIEIGPGAELILHKLGFKEVARVRKKREYYVFDDIEISLDRVEGLGGFVEFELRGGSVSTGKKRIFSLARELGLEGGERRSYLELLLERGVNPK